MIKRFINWIREYWKREFSDPYDAYEEWKKECDDGRPDYH